MFKINWNTDPAPIVIDERLPWEMWETEDMIAKENARFTFRD